MGLSPSLVFSTFSENGAIFSLTVDGNITANNITVSNLNATGHIDVAGKIDATSVNVTGNIIAWAIYAENVPIGGLIFAWYASARKSPQ